MIIGVDPDPAGAPALRDWTVGYWEALHPYSAGGAYVNFMMDEGQDRVKATYGDELRPARAGRRRTYDPENVFRVNQNIRPRSGGGERRPERLLLGQHALEQVAVRSTRAEHASIVKRRGSSSSSTSSQRSGVDTGAPGCGRTE